MKFYNKFFKKSYEINNQEDEQYIKAKDSINKLSESIKSLQITANNYIETLKKTQELNTNNINFSIHKDRL
jgi:hypothetical protein